MANYVKFRRGTPEAFKALGNRVEDDALYFIYDKDKSTADLYLGSKLISSGEHDLNALSELKLGDLVDTSIQDPLSSSDVLTYSEQAKKWVNRPIEELLETYIPEVDIETDGLSIENLDGKVQLKDFGTGYYAYVPAVKDKESGEIITPSAYEFTEGFKSGLEPRIAAAADGTFILAWYEPGTETVEGVAANIEGLSKSVEALESAINAEGGLSDQVEQISTDLNSKADADSVYTKEEINTTLGNIYTKGETDTAISEAVAAIDHLKRVVVESTDKIDLDAEDAENYIYMIPTGLTADDDKYDEYMVIDGTIERVGSWEIDLSGYIKAEEGKRLITDAEADKLENLLTINSVSSDFIVSADNQLSLNDLSVSKISDLATWLNDNAGTQKGLSENNLTNDLYSKLNNSLFISGVNTEQLSVDTSGVLSVLSISQNQVKGLADILNSKANTTQVTNLETQLNDMKDKVDEIEGRLMWQEIN